MERLTLEELYLRGYSKDREEAEVYKKYSVNDGLKFVKNFFNDQVINELTELYNLKIYAIGEVLSNVNIVFSQEGYKLDVSNPTPNANSLEGAMSQLLSIIPKMLESNKGAFVIGGTRKSVIFNNYAFIVERFFKHLRGARIKVEVEETVVVEFEDSSKEGFINVVEDFQDKIEAIKAVDNKTKALINDIKVDLGSLLKHLKDEKETFDFKDKLKSIKDIAIKSKPVWGAIGIASGIASLALAIF